MITAASADVIDSLLPQTQCGQCDYPGCRPYAEAIASGSAAINQCPPGGNELITELAALLDVPVMPLRASHDATAAPATAIIDEAVCIGCALCLPACPVDAIIGARRLMHTVIAAECTGCGLCLPPCPVNCISIRPTGAPRDHAAQRAASGRLRQRFLAHQQRLSTRGHERPGTNNGEAADDAARKRAKLECELRRAGARLE